MKQTKTDKLKEGLSTNLPEPFAEIARNVYYRFSDEKRDAELHQAFVDDIFDSDEECLSYYREVEELDKFHEGMGKYDLIPRNRGGIDSIIMDYYTLIRKFEPDVVVETGVCNGVSTLVSLLAMEVNEKGHLYSIDYPFFADEILEDFQEEVFSSYDRAVIPADKEPGWIVPDSLKNRWTLRTGKSQVELPKLRSEVDTIDMFFHDSEHSEPCMMFEYELAWEWIDSGILVSDDIYWNDAFDTFTSVRCDKWGKINSTAGYAIKE